VLLYHKNTGGKNMEDKLLLTTKECIEYIGIGETTLRNLAKTYDDIPQKNTLITLY